MPLPDPLRQQITDHLAELPHGWCRLEKALRLAEIIIDNKLERIIEIGIFGGRSIVPMALAVREQKRGCVFGLDPWDIEHATEGANGEAQDIWWKNLDFEAIRESFESHVNRHRLWEYLKWSRVGSVEAANMWKDGWADLVHLDADHAEETSCRDVRLWVPKVRESGWFVVDDSNWPTQRKALEILTNELGMAMVGSWSFEDGQAFAIYRKLPGVTQSSADQSRTIIQDLKCA